MVLVRKTRGIEIHFCQGKSNPKNRSVKCRTKSKRKKVIESFWKRIESSEDGAEWILISKYTAVEN